MERITCLDIITKKSVVNCECLVYTLATGVSVTDSEICDDFVEFNTVQLSIVPLNTIRSRFAVETNCFQSIYEVLIIITLLSNAIETVVILNPERNIPGLIIRPTVILSVGQIGLESGSHCVKWSGILLGHFEWPTVDQLWPDE